MPIYPTFDGRTPLTKAIANAMTAQSQAGARRSAGHQVNLFQMAGSAYQSAVGRATYGVWGKLIGGTQAGDVTYYDWVEQARKFDGSWYEHPTPLKGTFASDPAVEKTNRPGVLGEVVFLRRISGDLSADGRQQLWVFDSTFPGVWGYLNNSTTGAWASSLTLPLGIWDWSGPTSTPAVPGEAFYTGWFAPAHPVGETQQWLRETYESGGGGQKRVAAFSACQFSSGTFSLQTAHSPPFQFIPFGPALSFDGTSLSLDTTDPKLGPVVIAGIDVTVSLGGYPDFTPPPVWDFFATLSLIPTTGAGPACSSTRHLYAYPPGVWDFRPVFPFDRVFTPATFGLSCYAVIPVDEELPFSVTASLATAGPNTPDLPSASGRMWLEYSYSQ